MATFFYFFLSRFFRLNRRTTPASKSGPDLRGLDLKMFDFIGQTILLVLVAALWFNDFHIYGEGIYAGFRVFTFLAAALLFGLWQFISSLISVLLLAPLFKVKIVHLFFSILHIFLFSRFSELQYSVPCMLGIYYYILTCISCFGSHGE